MGELEKYVLVYVAGISGIWKGIPLGIGLDLFPLHTGLLTGFGSVTTVFILFAAGEAFRKWVINLYGEKRMERKAGKFLKFANQYGPWGLGLVTAGILGPVTSMLLGILFFTDRKKFVIILSFGILIWSVVFALIFTPFFDLISGWILFK